MRPFLKDLPENAVPFCDLGSWSWKDVSAWRPEIDLQEPQSGKRELTRAHCSLAVLITWYVRALHPTHKQMQDKAAECQHISLSAFHGRLSVISLKLPPLQLPLYNGLSAKLKANSTFLAFVLVFEQGLSIYSFEPDMQTKLDSNSQRSSCLSFPNSWTRDVCRHPGDPSFFRLFLWKP